MHQIWESVPDWQTNGMDGRKDKAKTIDLSDKNGKGKIIKDIQPDKLS